MGKFDSTKRRLCPYCKQTYTFTNWMKRRGERDANGYVLDDTHQISCYKILVATGLWRLPEPIEPDSKPEATGPAAG